MNNSRDFLNSLFNFEFVIPLLISKLSSKFGNENVGILCGFPLEILLCAISSTVLAPLLPSDVESNSIGLLYQTIFSILEIQSKIFLKAAV